jgi:hypothetical protein
MLRYAPERRRDWVEALLGELEFVRGDWAALFWALGCTSVVFRELLRVWLEWFGKKMASLFGNRSCEEENTMNSTRKKTLGVLAGVAIALALGVGFFFLRHAISDMLFAVGIPRTMWSHILSVILPAEIIVVVAAIVLWRRKLAPIAVGLLLTGFVMAAHVAVTVATH